MKFNLIIKPVWLAILAMALLSACEKPKEIESKPQLRPVRTLVVQSVDISKTLEFTAVVDAANRADLAFKISGELTTFLVKQGDKVSKGDIIAQLDDSDLQIYLAEAQAHYAKAMADLSRANKLLNTHYISAAEFDQIRTSAQSAQAQLASAQNNLSYSTLKASFDGIIAKVYSKNHQEINAKEPIVRLHDLSQIQLIVNIPESTMIHLQKNAIPIEVSAKFNSIKNHKFPLKFSEVSTVADEHSKTYEVIFTMEALAGYVILPGMTASVSAQVALSHHENQLQPSFYLPSNTVLKDAQGNYVFVVNTHAAGVGKVMRKSVVIGNITAQGIEVFTGLNSELKSGDHVVSAGMSKIYSGTLVKFINVSESGTIVHLSQLDNK
ncbi:efflux RND transporter periplasmic adaptor subunit [Colwellia psychrerythraea]|uniref:Efflux transporter, RND family, MFP subunit n=1 Tax=Colwellia psychrerythraea TaxID=28229 RepID=A0A099KUC3_COLPS|nr:efflux RND transporter periplasmic adaptor subunit [Colwellia psychrerythraea]KGJ93795.1 efflux transporter, RND family, MFP subunit [Colwellia psychrerythraea]